MSDQEMWDVNYRKFLGMERSWDGFGEARWGDLWSEDWDEEEDDDADWAA